MGDEPQITLITPIRLSRARDRPALAREAGLSSSSSFSYSFSEEGCVEDEDEHEEDEAKRRFRTACDPARG